MAESKKDFIGVICYIRRIKVITPKTIYSQEKIIVKKLITVLITYILVM